MRLFMLLALVLLALHSVQVRAQDATILGRRRRLASR